MKDIEPSIFPNTLLTAPAQPSHDMLTLSTTVWSRTNETENHRDAVNFNGVFPSVRKYDNHENWCTSLTLRKNLQHEKCEDQSIIERATTSFRIMWANWKHLHVAMQLGSI